MKIQVRQEHIDKGSPGSMEACPINHALREAFNTENIYVGMRTYMWLQQDFPCACVNGKDFRISKRAARWAIAFDNGKPVKPFVFNLMQLNAGR